ncbi:beta strand repeat-containing protein [Mangrovivirga cuniculi]|uniref:Autotransporter-associated beta strand repeat-containing protein n=1 Tax=Mangrovivirga cuniculi TaxID=2715131 RepID=A0A4D7JUP5_9BACT|nr:hypothetical protein [Mangrovivirga cuniculi]QCK15896.1 hypothetical protein DCC35_14680 [Mangrovivirga cuniculi]
MKKHILFTFLLFITLATIEAQTAGDYRSAQSGNWSDASTWETYDGATWVAASTAPSNADGQITILSGDIIDVASNINTDETIVETGAQITILTGNTLSIRRSGFTDLLLEGTLLNQGSLSIASGFGGSAQVIVNGTLNNQGTISGASINTLTFGANSIYDHQVNNGVIPTANWNISSTCIVSGSSTAGPTGLSQSFGNLTWNTPSLNTGGLYDVGMTSATEIRGEFLIESTGIDLLVLSDASTTILVSGNLTITGSSVVALTNTGNIILDIDGDFNYSSTQNSYFSNVGTGDINLAGNLTFTSGNLSIFDPSGNGSLIFDGTSTQSVNITGGSFDGTNDPDFVISAGSDISMLNESAFNGSGDFTLNVATLRLGSTNASGALQAGTAGGNIRTSGTRTYAAGSLIVYDGASSQVIGNGFPTDSNLEIDNPTDVSLNATTTIGGNRMLSLTNGILDIGPNTLFINGNVETTNGFLRGGATSNLIIGGTGALGTIPFIETSQLNNFTVNRTSSGSVTLGGDLTVLGTFDQLAGNFVINDASFNINGDYTRTGGTFFSNANTDLRITGAGSLPAELAFGTDQSLNTLTMSRDGATLATNASITIDTLNLYAGIVDNSAATYNISDQGYIERWENGSITTAPLFDGVYNLIYNNSLDIVTGPELTGNALALNDLTKQGSARLSTNKTFSVNGNLEITNGIFDITTNYARLRGDLIITAGTDFIDGVFEFAGGDAELSTVTGQAVVNFGQLNVYSPVDIPSNDTDITIAGNFEVNNTITVAGTTTFTGTTLMSGPGTAALNRLEITGSLSAIPEADGGELQVAGTLSIVVLLIH